MIVTFWITATFIFISFCLWNTRFFRFTAAIATILFMVTLYGLIIVKHGENKTVVIGVTDGDTFKVSSNNKQEVVRMSNIDAPERSQDYGKQARYFLTEKIYGKNVILWHTKYDRYGRILAEVYMEDENINLAMVKNGLAWQYKQYSDDPKYAEAETKARKEKINIWSKPDPIPPWNFRKAKR